MNCIAVDDEKLILDLLVDNIRQVPYLNLVGRCKNAMEAADVLRKEKVDLIFLDIQMPGLNGLQFVQTLTTPPMVIFVTAYREYAVESFNVNAVDYLVKPVSFERFLKACNKAQELFSLQRKGMVKEDHPGYFFVNIEYKQVKITISDILYIEAIKDYVKIFLASAPRPAITKMSLKSLEEKLAPHRFARIHKSFLVSLDRITAVKRDIVAVGEFELPLSENYKDNLGDILKL
jgi:two-component system, LytTR family, response regulator